MLLKIKYVPYREPKQATATLEYSVPESGSCSTTLRNKIALFVQLNNFKKRKLVPPLIFYPRNTSEMLYMMSVIS